MNALWFIAQQQLSAGPRTALPAESRRVTPSRPSAPASSRSVSGEIVIVAIGELEALGLSEPHAASDDATNAASATSEARRRRAPRAGIPEGGECGAERPRRGERIIARGRCEKRARRAVSGCG